MLTRSILPEHPAQRTRIIPVLLMLIPMLVLTGCATTSADRDRDTAETLYTVASEALEAGDYPAAIRAFQQLEVDFPAARHTIQARMEIAFAYYQDGDPASAIAAAGRFIRAYPDHPRLDYLYYLRGLARFDQAMQDLAALDASTGARPPTVDLALQHFAELIGRYPDSRYSIDARNRLAHLRQQLARHELAAARKHINRGEYTSAALRARSVIEHFPESGLATEAATVVNMANRMLNLEGDLDGTRDPSGDPSAHPAAVLPEGEHEQDSAPATSSPVEPASDAGDIRREDWISAQSPEAWTIQLLGTTDEPSLRAFISGHGLDEAAYYASTRDDRHWYSLVYGIFEDIDAARAAAERMPRAVLGDSPWIRRVGDIHAVIDLEQRLE